MVWHAANQIFFGKEESKNKMEEIYLFKTKLLVMILSPAHQTKEIWIKIVRILFMMKSNEQMFLMHWTYQVNKMLN